MSSTAKRFVPDPRLKTIVRWTAVRIRGDVANFTTYTTRRGRFVMYPAAPPTKPPSPLQQVERLRFKRAQRAWRLTTPTVKRTWEDLVNRLAIVMTGQNAYIALALVPDPIGLTRHATAVGLSITHPEEIPR